METYIKNCIICNKQFSYRKYASQEQQNPKLCCSKRCSYQLISQKTKGISRPRSKDKDKWVIHTCKNCGKKFRDYASNKRKFCSWECKSFGKKTYTKKCVICKKEFSYQKYPSHEKFKPKLCCSKKCSYELSSIKLSSRFIPNQYNEKNESKWKIYKCKQCEKSFEALKSRKPKFCSVKCKGEWQKENLKGKNNPNWKPTNLKNPYTHIHHQIRKQLVKERKKCENCESKIHLQVHHKDRDRRNNTPNNLLLLCKICHANLHKEEGEPRIAQFIMNHPTQK